MKSLLKMGTGALTAFMMMLFAGAASAVTFATGAGNALYTGLVTNVLNGEIGYVISIGLVAMGIFFLFRSAAMGVLSLAAAIVFWNAENILNAIGYVL